MRPFTERRAARALAITGAFGAAGCTVLTAGAASASSATPAGPSPFSARFGPPGRGLIALAPLSRWTPADSAAAAALFRRAVLARAARRWAAAADAANLSVRRMVAAGNRIARLPYVWGGGHGSFDAAGYDCSGSVSYVLHAAGLLSVPEDSTGLESFGEPGPGRYVTIYANAGHAWMTIAGRRFDTIALQEGGTRWSNTISSPAGYVVRHPHGL
jgi:cell wall-associated NlpC family hydrolase